MAFSLQSWQGSLQRNNVLNRDASHLQFKTDAADDVGAAKETQNVELSCFVSMTK